MNPTYDFNGQVALVGGKGAQLGELSRIDGIRVPPGFCVTTDAFRRIMSEAPSIDDRRGRREHDHQLDAVVPVVREHTGGDERRLTRKRHAGRLRADERAQRHIAEMCGDLEERQHARSPRAACSMATGAASAA